MFHSSHKIPARERGSRSPEKAEACNESTELIEKMAELTLPDIATELWAEYGIRTRIPTDGDISNDLLLELLPAESDNTSHWLNVHARELSHVDGFRLFFRVDGDSLTGAGECDFDSKSIFLDLASLSLDETILDHAIQHEVYHVRNLEPRVFLEFSGRCEAIRKSDRFLCPHVAPNHQLAKAITDSFIEGYSPLCIVEELEAYQADLHRSLFGVAQLLTDPNFQPCENDWRDWKEKIEMEFRHLWNSILYLSLHGHLQSELIQNFFNHHSHTDFQCESKFATTSFSKRSDGKAPLPFRIHFPAIEIILWADEYFHTLSDSEMTKFHRMSGTRYSGVIESPREALIVWMILRNRVVHSALSECQMLATIIKLPEILAKLNSEALDSRTAAAISSDLSEKLNRYFMEDR